MALNVITNLDAIKSTQIETLDEWKQYQEVPRKGYPMAADTKECITLLFERLSTDLHGKLTAMEEKPVVIQVAHGDLKSDNRPNFYQGAYKWFQNHTPYTIRSASRRINAAGDIYLILWLDITAQKLQVSHKSTSRW